MRPHLLPPPLTQPLTVRPRTLRIQREGQGTFFFANGSRYVGEWVDNQKHGDGLLSFEDGSVYQGPFVNDRMSDGRLRPHTELFSYIDLTKVQGLHRTHQPWAPCDPHAHQPWALCDPHSHRPWALM